MFVFIARPDGVQVLAVTVITMAGQGQEGGSGHGPWYGPRSALSAARAGGGRRLCLC